MRASIKTLFLCATLLLLLTAGMFYARSINATSSLWPDEDRTDQVKFDHSKHSDAACTDCHAAVTSEHAEDNLLPNPTKCKDCHEEKDVRGFLKIDASVPLSQASFMRKDKPIHFSHAKHITVVGKDCNVCHANFTKIAYSSESPMRLPTMTVCVNCHSDQASTVNTAAHAVTAAPTACLACHTTMTGLLPPSHREADFRTTHKHAVRLGAQKENCASCHTDASCQSCHSGSGVDASAVASRFYAPEQPRVEAMDNARPMVVQQVHRMNFRFTHGLDADAKSTECQSCHEPATFCAQCHGSKQEAVGFSPVPPSHGAAGFIVLGVGSGGGLHATLGRRDIEQCAACHQQDGTEPACVKCHIDPDGIKNTNPRTHEPGFMKSTNGSWHEDAGAACYVCHVDAHAHPGDKTGLGFCGYCHAAKPGRIAPLQGGSSR